ncbi:GNAT family N-acetyltransferase [Nocardiopsis sediminis]|uniref:GNAT family N-acetyltransferase n=1 Tax=Nocardiopsis sediminis TaxID=1778267 RepID=A0ABV8FHT7_9ACTN
MPSAINDSEVVRGLQERAARALPAAQVEDVGGWWLRHAPGCSWWVGAVLPHGDAGPGELTRRVARAEEFYAGRGAKARFQITPPACPEGLDTVLADRGYLRENTVSLQVASAPHVAGQAAAGATRVRLDDRPVRTWFETAHALHGGDPCAAWHMLDRVERLCVYASALVDGEVVAVGRAVADSGWVGVFGMATAPGARGKGAGRDVLAALADWAGTQDADRMYLQVERDNCPAVRLYERTGFGEICTYHYRTAR